jgi:tRNA A-37 threonylcarbamoyl transferase component Bud32
MIVSKQSKMSSGSQSYIKFVNFQGERAVAKWSKRIDYVVELEHQVLNKLKKMRSPHYVEPLALKRYTSQSVTVPKLIMKRVEGPSFYEFIKKSYGRDNATRVIKNMAYMTLCACELMRLKYGIVHNDLHTSNVIITKTEYDAHVYAFPDGTRIELETYGYCPVIIDFGYAYAENCKMLAPLSFSDIGYSTFTQDALADARILLSRVANGMRKYAPKSDVCATEFVALTRAQFGALKLNKGWFPSQSFDDVLLALIETVKDDDRVYSNVFNPDLEYIEDVLTLFTGQMTYTTDIATDIATNISDAAKLAFQKFATIVSRYEPFKALIRSRHQLSFIKELFSFKRARLIKKYNVDIVPICTTAMTAVNALQPVVFSVLRGISLAKRQSYQQLTINTTMDILPKESAPRRDGVKIRTIDVEGATI